MTTESAHEEAKFEEDIIARRSARLTPAFYKVIGSEHENRKIKLVCRRQKRFQSSISEAKNTLTPDGDLAGLIQKDLNYFGDFQALT
jgi:hypothetical protein